MTIERILKDIQIVNRRRTISQVECHRARQDIERLLEKALKKVKEK